MHACMRSFPFLPSRKELWGNVLAREPLLVWREDGRWLRFYSIRGIGSVTLFFSLVLLNVSWWLTPVGGSVLGLGVTIQG